MQKKDVPKPKYSIDDHVVYIKGDDTGGTLKRCVGQIDRIEIGITKGFTSVAYGFSGTDEMFGQEDIQRRVVTT